MRGKFGFEHILGIFVAAVCTMIGLTSMIGLTPAVRELKAQIAERFSDEETELLEVPVSGMNVTISEYVATNEENAINFLSTTVLLDSGSENEYLNEDGSCEGKYIVCTASDYASVYSETFDEDTDAAGEIARIETYGTATLISTDGTWCEIVSGGVIGYVKASDFAFGQDAQALDEYTYRDIASVNEDGVYLYELANASSTVLCVIDAGYSFEVLYAGENYTELYVDGIGECYVKTDLASVETVRITAELTQDIEEKAAAVAQGIEKADELGPSFIWPLAYPYYSNYITSSFGYRSGSYHSGTDIHAAYGTSIYAVMDGVVVESGYGSSEGYKVIIYHGDGLYTLYYHMNSYPEVEVGDTVKQGDTIGYVGSTGNSTGNHLHIGVGVGGYTKAYLVDPMTYLGQ